jgi:phosphate transport system substrate-binding protein
VGGADVEIIPFQRNAEAGSQTGMRNLVMKDLELMEPPKDYIIDSMAGLIEAVRGYDDSAGAIGYSVYYYANDMRMAEGLKIIAVDGVDPQPETIADESYPFLASYYAVVPALTPENSPARRLWSWLQGEEGQYLMEQLGYVPVKES